MDGDRTWTPLHFEHDATRARSIVTSIAAMEFDVRLVHAHTGREIDHDVDPGMWYDSGWRVEVRADDWRDLDEVLEDIIGEQHEFDEMLAGRQRRALIVNWVVLGGTALAVATVMLLAGLRLG